MIVVTVSISLSIFLNRKENGQITTRCESLKKDVKHRLN